MCAWARTAPAGDTIEPAPNLDLDAVAAAMNKLGVVKPIGKDQQQ